MQQLLLTIAFVLLSVFIAHSKEGKINLIKTIVKVKNNKITEEEPIFFLILINENHFKLIVNSEPLALEMKF